MSQRATRRAAIQRGLGAAAGLTGTGLLAPTVAGTARADAETDLELVESAIELERGLALAYETIATGDLLDEEVGRAVELFATQELEHFDALAAAVEDLGGRATGPAAPAEIEGLSALESQREALELAIELENGIVATYVDAAEATSNAALLRTFAQILGCQAQHLAVLRQQLGADPVPEAFEEGESVI